jgi:hypothetical protein
LSLPALLLGQAPAGVKQADDAPPAKAGASLFPLKKGLKWEWSGTDLDNACKWVDEVRGVRKINGTECYELHRTVYLKKGIGVWQDGGSGDRQYLAVSEDGVFEVGYAHSFDNGKEYPEYRYYSRPICLLNFKALAGPTRGKSGLRTWSWTEEEKFDSRGNNLTEKPEFRWAYEFTARPDTVSLAGKEVDTVLTVRKNRDREEVLSTWYVPGRGPVKVKFELFRPGKKGLVRHDMEVVSFQDPTFELGVISLNEAAVEKEASVETVETQPGVMTKFKKSRTISRQVSWSTTIGVGAEVEGKLAISLGVVRGELSTKVKGSIEKTIGEKLTDSETREVEVAIDGDKLPKAKIVWIDLYRTGTVEVTQDGKNYKIPFEFPIGTKLIVRKP